MKIIKTLNQHKGQSLVEFAITLTIMMTLLAGAVEFGIALFQFVQLRDAAQEGALYGSLNPGDLEGIEDHVRAASDTPIDLQGAPGLVITSTTTGDACEGDAITVQITFPHRISMPFVSAIVGSQDININVSVTDTILRSDPANINPTAGPCKY